MNPGAAARDRRLLIGYDGSPNGADALALGGLLSDSLTARPVVVEAISVRDQVFENGPGGSLTLSELRSRLATEAEPELRMIGDDVPARALRGEIEAQRPLAVVIGSAHRGPIGRVLAGSVGETLLGAAGCPVAVAPRGFADAGDRDLLRVGAAFDGSEESEAALSAAIAFALRNNSSLTILTVAEHPAYAYSAPFAGGAGAVAAGQNREREMERVLDRAVARVPAALPVVRHLIRGEPVATIAAAAADLELLFVGSHACGPLRRVLLGSVSSGLVKAARCPVLAVPRGSGADPLRLAEVGESGLAGAGAHGVEERDRLRHS